MSLPIVKIKGEDVYLYPFVHSTGSDLRGTGWVELGPGDTKEGVSHEQAKEEWEVNRTDFPVLSPEEDRADV